MNTLPAIYIPRPGDLETIEKMAKVRALTDAILRARDAHAREKTYATAANIQHLERQRRELQRLLPRLVLLQGGKS
jgi:hypothetical protein